MTSTWTRSLVVAMALVLLAGPANAADPSPDVVYPDDPALQRAYEDGFYRGADEGYTQGRDDGYQDGHKAGLSEGELNGRREATAEMDQDDLRDDVEGQADDDADEGGTDLSGEITPTPTPDDAATTVTQPDSSDNDGGPGIPWWPLSFAVVASIWFITRRRRLDAGEVDESEAQAQ